MWEDAAREAGIAFGRAGMRDRFNKTGGQKATKNKHYLIPLSGGSQMFLNTTYADISRFCEEYYGTRTHGEEDDEGGVEDGALKGKFDWAPRAQRSLRALPSLDDESSFIFDYCRFLATPMPAPIPG